MVGSVHVVFYHENKFTWFHHHSMILFVRPKFGCVVCIERDQIACLDSWPTMVVYLLYLPFKLLVRSKSLMAHHRMDALAHTPSHIHTHTNTYTHTLRRFKNKVCNGIRPIIFNRLSVITKFQICRDSNNISFYL